VKRPSAARGDELSAVTPELVAITDEILYDRVWERPELSPRDRSLITIAALVAGFKIDHLPNHIRLGLKNGLTREEIGEAITHLAFYSSWPNATAAARKLLDVTKALDSGEAKLPD